MGRPRGLVLEAGARHETPEAAQRALVGFHDELAGLDAAEPGLGSYYQDRSPIAVVAQLAAWVEYVRAGLSPTAVAAVTGMLPRVADSLKAYTPHPLVQVATLARPYHRAGTPRRRTYG